MASRRLTVMDKEAFIRAVLADVPRIDYHEEIKKVLDAYLAEIAPAAVLSVFKKHPEYFDQRQVRTYGEAGHYYGEHYLVPEGFDLEEPPAPLVRVKELLKAQGAQSAALNTLEVKVKGMIRGFTTVAKAKEAMPEFAKYLPDDTAAPSKNLPVANVVGDLIRAGWPKDKQLEAA